MSIFGDPDGRGVAEAVEVALAAASHLTVQDAAAVQALRYLATKIDSERLLREQQLRWAAEHGEKPPPIDNVSVPTFLKYCNELGLTPAGRQGDRAAAGGGSKSVSKVAQMRSVQQAQAG